VNFEPVNAYLNIYGKQHPPAKLESAAFELFLIKISNIKAVVTAQVHRSGIHGLSAYLWRVQG